MNSKDPGNQGNLVLRQIHGACFLFTYRSGVDHIGFPDSSLRDCHRHFGLIVAALIVRGEILQEDKIA